MVCSAGPFRVVFVCCPVQQTRMLELMQDPLPLRPKTDNLTENRSRWQERKRIHQNLFCSPHFAGSSVQKHGFSKKSDHGKGHFGLSNGKGFRTTSEHKKGERQIMVSAVGILNFARVRGHCKTEDEESTWQASL